MKAKIVIVATSFLMLSCQKEVELETTFVQIKTTSVWDNSPIGNVDFSINAPYIGSNYGLDDTTNSYGNYNGCYINEKKQPYELRLSEKYYLVGGPKVLQGSVENILNLEIAELGKFQFDLDCGIGGSIANLKRQRLVPTPEGSPVYYATEGQIKIENNPSCAVTLGVYDVFAGKWLITYQKKPASSSVWTNYSDTIEVLPGETYIHHIDY